MNNQIKNNFGELPKIKQVHQKWTSRSGMVASDRPAFHAREAAIVQVSFLPPNCR